MSISMRPSSPQSIFRRSHSEPNRSDAKGKAKNPSANSKRYVVSGFLAEILRAAWPVHATEGSLVARSCALLGMTRLKIRGANGAAPVEAPSFSSVEAPAFRPVNKTLTNTPALAAEVHVTLLEPTMTERTPVEAPAFRRAKKVITSIPALAAEVHAA